MHRLALLLVTLVLSFQLTLGAVSQDQVDHVYANIFAMQKHVELHIKNHEFRDEKASCNNDVLSLQRRLKAQEGRLDNIRDNLAEAQQKVASQKDYIKDLEQTYEEEHAAWLEAKKPEEEDIKAQQAAIEKIKVMARKLSDNNPDRKEVVDKIIAILDDILKQLQQRFDDLQVNKALDALQLKINNAKKRLTHLRNMVKKAKKAKAEAIALVQTLKDRIEDLKKVCQGIQDKLDAAIKLLENDLKQLQKVLDLLEKFRKQSDDEDDPDDIAKKELDYEKLEKMIRDLIDAVKEEILGLKDPRERCDKEKASLKGLINEKKEKEQQLNNELIDLNSRKGNKQEKIANLTAQYDTLEGQLKEVTEQCETLGERVTKDKSLLQEVAAIGQIIQLVNDLHEEEELTAETSDRMNKLLNKIKNELLDLIAAKLQKAKDKYQQCKAHRGDLMNQYEKKGEELHNLQRVYEELLEDIKETNEKLEMTREDKKALVDLLTSKTAECEKAIKAYEKVKKEHEDDLKILDRVIELLEKNQTN